MGIGGRIPPLLAPPYRGLRFVSRQRCVSLPARGRIYGPRLAATHHRRFSRHHPGGVGAAAGAGGRRRSGHERAAASQPATGGFARAGRARIACAAAVVAGFGRHRQLRISGTRAAFRVAVGAPGGMAAGDGASPGGLAAAAGFVRQTPHPRGGRRRLPRRPRGKRARDRDRLPAVEHSAAPTGCGSQRPHPRAAGVHAAGLASAGRLAARHHAQPAAARTWPAGAE